jgi:hypothetical protein
LIVLVAEGSVPLIALFRNDTAASIHDLPADSLSNVADGSSYVLVQVFTPVGVPDHNKELGVVRNLPTSSPPRRATRRLPNVPGVLITESVEGGWGINGHVSTGAAASAASDRDQSHVSA